MALRIRQVPDDSTISGTQTRHEPRGLQDDLLVGMVASAAGTTDRRDLPSAIFGVPRAWHNSTGPAYPAVEHVCRRRSARGGWLVDGVFRAHARRECLAISSGIPLDARDRDLWRDCLDRAATGNAGGARGARAPALCRVHDRAF